MFPKAPSIVADGIFPLIALNAPSAAHALECPPADSSDPAALARRWIDTVGEERLVWGSDWPWTRHESENDYGRLREALDRWVGAKRARAIVWDNAARLYDFA